MTTGQVENYANGGNLAGPDLNIGGALRFKVIPEFMEDCKHTPWAQKWASQTVLAGAQSFALPADYNEMIRVHLEGDEAVLPYVGDHPETVVQAEAATADEAGIPSAWYVTYNSDGFRLFKFDCVLSEDIIVRYLYRFRIPFTEDNNPVELAPYIPERWHWALVEGLKREIYADRYGMGDPRYTVAAQEFENWKDRALRNADMAPGGTKMKFAR